MTTFALSEISASDCFLSIKTSGEFIPSPISGISSSLVSQYIREIKPISSSGIINGTTFLIKKIVLKVKNKINVRVILVNLGTYF